MLKEFKEFALRGNVVDLAVGVIIGAAFGKIVTSLVEDIIMPPISHLIGDVDFQNLFITLGSEDYETLAAAKEAGAATINYGVFLNVVLQFLIVAFIIFLLVRQINKMRSEPQPETPTSRDCPYCMSTIPKKATRCPQCTSEIKAA